METPHPHGSRFDPESEATVDGSLLALLRAVAAAPAAPLEAPAPATASGDLAPGTVLDDQFEILDKLGAGGMGVVYRARDRRLDREVALKVLRFDAWPTAYRDRLRVAFENEARATARLHHPNVVTIHQVGSAGGAVYLVLELLAGRTLGARLKTGGPLPPLEAIDVVHQILRGLAHAHGAGLIHRDVKPQNVYLADDGSVKVLDFGLAGFDHVSRGQEPRALAARLADTIASGGTPGYMAPEQWDGGSQDGRTDLFAAGVLLFRLLTGRHPFDPSFRPAPGPRPSVRSHLPELPEVLDRFMTRAIAHDPSARFPTAQAMMAVLESARREVVEAAALAGRERAREQRRRGGWFAAAAVAIVALLGVATWRAFVSWQRARDAALAEGIRIDGRWRNTTPILNYATLTRLGPRTWLFEGEAAPYPALPTADIYRHRGELHAEVDERGVILRGRVADLPGYCCGNVGFLEVLVVSDAELRVLTASWGKTHDAYVVAKLAFSYVRPGPGE